MLLPVVSSIYVFPDITEFLAGCSISSFELLACALGSKHSETRNNEMAIALR